MGNETEAIVVDSFPVRFKSDMMRCWHIILRHRPSLKRWVCVESHGGHMTWYSLYIGGGIWEEDSRGNGKAEFYGDR